MKTIFYYRVEIGDATGILSAEQTFKREEVYVLAENENYICIEDYRFTSIRKHKSDYDICLNKASIGMHHADSVWGNRVTYTKYSDKPIKAERIRAEIEKEIRRKLGFFVSGLDLSIVKD